MGGSCMNEAAVADYFAGLSYDAVLLENEVNMGEAMAEEYARNGRLSPGPAGRLPSQLPVWR